MPSPVLLLAALVALSVALSVAPAAQGVGAASTPSVIGEVGTWELIEAEDTPGGDTPIFVRMTFTGRSLKTVTVFLDPDDGELSARVTSDSYITSNGQLVVRATGSTTVLDVSRDTDDVGADVLVVRDLRVGTRLRLRLHPADPAGALDPALVGAWAGQDQTHSWTFRFEPDGRSFVRRSGQDRDHEEPYTVAGPYLLVDQDVYRFTFASNRLILSDDVDTIELSRVAYDPPRTPR